MKDESGRATYSSFILHPSSLEFRLCHSVPNVARPPQPVILIAANAAGFRTLRRHRHHPKRPLAELRTGQARKRGWEPAWIQNQGERHT